MSLRREATDDPHEHCWKTSCDRPEKSTTIEIIHMRKKTATGVMLSTLISLTGCTVSRHESVTAKPASPAGTEAKSVKSTATKSDLTKPAAPGQPQSQSPQSDLDYLRSKVQALASTGLITNVDAESSTARVDPEMWDALDVQEKQTVAKLLSMYIGHAKGRKDGVGISVQSSRNDSVFAEVSMWTGSVTINR